MKNKIIFIYILITALLFGIIYIAYLNKSHLGYLEYLYASITNGEVNLLENKLMITLADNPEQLFDVFDIELEKFPKNKNVCHGIVHKLGHEAFELYGFEGAMNIAKSSCGAGFIHGVLESKLGSFITEDEIKEALNICSSDDEFCNHGMGHGLMVLTDNDIYKALDYCDSLELGAHSDCYDGVFMHIFDNEETGISKDIPERYEEEKLCIRMDQKYQKSCVFYLPRIYIGEKEWAPLSRNICSNFTNDNYITCLVGTGTMFGKYLYNSVDETNNLCDVFGDESAVCLEGVRLYRDIVF